MDYRVIVDEATLLPNYSADVISDLGKVGSVSKKGDTVLINEWNTWDLRDVSILNEKAKINADEAAEYEEYAINHISSNYLNSEALWSKVDFSKPLILSSDFSAINTSLFYSKAAGQSPIVIDVSNTGLRGSYIADTFCVFPNIYSSMSYKDFNLIDNSFDTREYSAKIPPLIKDDLQLKCYSTMEFYGGKYSSIQLTDDNTSFTSVKIYGTDFENFDFIKKSEAATYIHFSEYENHVFTNIIVNENSLKNVEFFSSGNKNITFKNCNFSYGYSTSLSSLDDLKFEDSTIYAYFEGNTRYNVYGTFKNTNIVLKTLDSSGYCNYSFNAKTDQESVFIKENRSYLNVVYSYNNMPNLSKVFSVRDATISLPLEENTLPGHNIRVLSAEGNAQFDISDTTEDQRSLFESKISFASLARQSGYKAILENNYNSTISEEAETVVDGDYISFKISEKDLDIINKNEWYNIAEEFCGDHSIVISGMGYYSSESRATSVGFTNITTTSENGYLTIKAKYSEGSQLLSNLRSDTDYIVLHVLHYFGKYPVYNAVDIRVPLKVLETVAWRLEKVTE